MLLSVSTNCTCFLIAEAEITPRAREWVGRTDDRDHGQVEQRLGLEIFGQDRQ